MERAWTYLERLSRYPHRGVGTEEEKAAANEAAGWLREMGYTVDITPFYAPRDTLYLGPAAIMALFLVAGGLGLAGLPWAGLLVGLLALVPLVGEMKGKNLDLDVYLRKVTSQNVIARRPGQGDERITVVLTAHIDTQRATWLFHPRFLPYIQSYFNAAYGSLALMLLGLVLRAVSPGTSWSVGIIGVAGILLVGHIIFLVGCTFSGSFINGANDNGSGVALALALAEHFAANPVPGVQVQVVLTGAEEVGTRGMKQLLKQEAYTKGSTYFINLDNLGGGKLYYLKGEGMTLYHPYSPSMVSLAGVMAAEQAGQVAARPNLLLPTDGMIPAAAGHHAISFLAFNDDGSLPNYHWYSDNLENVDPKLLAFTERFVIEYVERLVYQGAAVT